MRALRRLRANVDLFMLAILAILVITSWVVAELADEVQEGSTQRWDNWMLRQFRRPGDMTTPIGPAWFRDAWRDITALGSGAVLALVTLGVAGYLLIRRQYRMLVLLVVATISGAALALLLKSLFSRPRPPFVSDELFIMTW